MVTRRTFLGALVLVAARPIIASARTVGASPSGPHPEPRPGITSAKVLTREQLHDKELAPLFDMVREIPRVADGIGCRCGCAAVPGMRSLLSCYEADGMAQHCQICQNAAKLAYRMHKDGRSLADIRAAIDKEFE